MQEIRELALEEELNELTDCTFEVMINKAAAKGFMKGLALEDFELRYLPENFQELLENPNYQMHEGIWAEINKWECAEQAPLIYAVAKEVHLARALKGIRTGERPLGILKGREHLAMPLELAGKYYYTQLVKGLHPVLKRFGLDKGVVQDKTGGVTYPWAVKYFAKKRRELFEREHLDSYDNMFRFVARASDHLGDWPSELSRPFDRDWELALDAINQIAVHYY
ncbi:hypothetical protein IJG66_01045 [Candidatus Saccharibacteria bacterium]|nr:hypothetical protein [Candidatus Saccharibacteria bacterium]